jgi:predicted lysophospholipase L1 biosynthesis ABC-type transport system permease subunit
MQLRNIILLYGVRLRARLAHELFAILGIAVGVALLFASQIVGAGHQGQVHAELERLASGRLSVQAADYGTTLFNQAAAPSNQAAELFSTIGVLVGFLFALNALMLTASQRHNFVADLRLDGYSRRMIVEVLLFDALVLGVLASLLGLALGDLLSAVLFSSNSGYLSFAFPIDAQRIVTWQSIVFATCGGLLAASAGVLISLRGAILSHRLLGAAPARVRATSGLRVVLGELVCGTITAVTLLAAPSMAIVGIVIALLLALPWLLGACLRVADRLQRSLSSTAIHLAVIELRSAANWSRTLAIAATGATAVFGSVAVEGAQRNLQRGLNRTAHDLAAPAEVWVTAAGAQNVLATSAYAISLRPGVSPREARREIQRALAPGGVDLTVETRSEHERRLRASSQQGLSRLTQITSLVLIAAILAMATTMGAMVWQRRPLLADMKVDGFGKGVLWRSLLVESVLLLGVGGTIGALFGLCGQLVLSHALAVMTGFPVVASIGALVAIGSLCVVTSVAVAFVAVPGYLAARVRAAIVLRD